MLIVLNVAVFVVELILLGDFKDVIFFTKQSAGFAMLATGGNYWLATIREGRFETLVSSCFVHAGLLHLGFNMAALRQVGPFVERAVGSARMLPAYLISGFVGSFVSTFVHVMRGHDSVGVGASGAVCGLIGMALVIGWRVQGKNSPILRAMASWLVTIFVLGALVSGIDNSAHAGGAIGGAVIALLWRRGIVYTTLRKWIVLGLCSIVLVATAARVVYFDLQVPYATYTFDDRLKAARNATIEGDCKNAHASIEAARRLSPTDPHVAVIQEEIAVRCD